MLQRALNIDKCSLLAFRKHIRKLTYSIILKANRSDIKRTVILILIKDKVNFRDRRTVYLST